MKFSWLDITGGICSHVADWGMSPGGHCWDYYPGALSCIQVSATHVNIRHPLISSMGAWSSNELQISSTGAWSSNELQISSTGAWSSNELQWLDLKRWHQDNSPSYGHQSMPHCRKSFSWAVWFMKIAAEITPRPARWSIKSNRMSWNISPYMLSDCLIHPLGPVIFHWAW